MIKALGGPPFFRNILGKGRGGALLAPKKMLGVAATRKRKIPKDFKISILSLPSRPFPGKKILNEDAKKPS